jgi:hypothetical protein
MAKKKPTVSSVLADLKQLTPDEQQLLFVQCVYEKLPITWMFSHAIEADNEHKRQLEERIKDLLRKKELTEEDRAIVRDKDGGMSWSEIEEKYSKLGYTLESVRKQYQRAKQFISDNLSGYTHTTQFPT